MRKKFIIILALSVCIALFPVLSAGASENESSVFVILKNDGQAVEDVVFTLYYIAKKENGKLVPYGDFSGMKININYNDSSQRSGCATAVKAFALANGVEPYATGKTDKSGNIFFGGLKPGLYLVSSESYTFDAEYYSAVPFFAEIAQEKADNLIVYPKTENIGNGKMTVSRKVFIKWEDEGYEEERPQEVEVTLLRDGEVYDTVILTEEDEWTYTWGELDSEHEWLIYEEVPGEYVTEFSQEGTTYEITHILEKENPQEETTTAQSETTTENTSTTENISTTENASTSESSSTTQSVLTTKSNSTTQNDSTTKKSDSRNKEKLPQTGQLWTPVLLLSIAGLFFIIIGIAQNKGDDDE